ncbi:MAG: GxxExxY protein [Acidobacteriota bacterium]|nr:GxxExxY protein [Acidobacteriota bacterium]
MNTTDDRIEALTETIIGCAIEVHRTLGPGLLEAVYRECLILELRGRSLDVEIERHVPLDYKGQRIRSRLTVDLLVQNCVVVELKAVESLHAGLRRLDHPDRYAKKRSRSGAKSEE